MNTLSLSVLNVRKVKLLGAFTAETLARNTSAKSVALKAHKGRGYFWDLKYL